MSKFDVFIFDWDGTLNSVKSLKKLNEKLNPGRWALKKLHAHDKRQLSKAEISRIVMRKENRNLGREAFAPIVDLSIRLMTPKLHNGAKEVLDKLAHKNKKVAMLTNGASWRVMRELSYLGVEDYFEAVVSTQEIGALKPNPLGLQVLMKAIGGKKERTLYIGDMVDDILVAREAGIRSCAVSCGFDEYFVLKRAGPDYIFKSLEELEKAL